MKIDEIDAASRNIPVIKVTPPIAKQDIKIDIEVDPKPDLKVSAIEIQILL